MTSADIDIILKTDEFITVQINLDGKMTWNKEYSKETKIKQMYEDYEQEVRSEFPKEIKSILKSLKDKDVTIEEEPLLNYANGYEEDNTAFSKINNLEIPEIIGKPFSNPFTVFNYIKKEKALKVLKFGNNSKLNELDDYNSSSAYCNGNNKLFISGGEKNKGEYTEKFWIIDLKTAEIESNDMIPKKNHSMIIIPGNYVFIVGGQTKQTFYFDLENSQFHGWKKLNKQRIEPALIVVDNYLYCFDNMNSNFEDKLTFEKTNLNSSEHNWELFEPNMPSIRMNQKYFGVVKSNNDIIFIGGNLDIENEEENLTERKNFKYNLNNNSIEESETNYINYNFKEKTFLKYNEKISYILPDFNRYHPEVMFYQKEKNAIKFLKCYSKKKLEEKEREKIEKNNRDFSPIKITMKYNLNQPKDDNNIIKEEIKPINENSENKNEEKKDQEEEKKVEEQNNEYDQNNINNFNNFDNLDNFNNFDNFDNKKSNNEQNPQEIYEANPLENQEKEKEKEFETNEQVKENEQNAEQDIEQHVEKEVEQNIVQNEEKKDEGQNEEEKVNEEKIYEANPLENQEKEKEFETNEQVKENEQNAEQYIEQHVEKEVEQNIVQNEEKKDEGQNEEEKVNEEKESNAIDNDINTNNLEMLDDILKSSQKEQQENIEIKVEGNPIENQDINLRGQINNINPEEQLANIDKSKLNGNIRVETSAINPINDPKINMNLPQTNIDVKQSIDLKVSNPDINIPQTNVELKKSTDIQGSIPYVNIPQSNIDLKQSTDIKGSIPNINPQTNVNNPNLNVGQSNLSLGVNNPNIEIKNPEINGGLNTGIKGNNMKVVDFTNIKTLVDGTKYETQCDFCLKGVMVGTTDDKNKYAKYNYEGNMNMDKTGINYNGPNMDTNLNINMLNINTGLNNQSLNMPNNDTNLNTNIGSGLNLISLNDPNLNTNLNADMPNLNLNGPNLDTNLNMGLLQGNINLIPPENELGEFCMTGIIIGKNETNPQILNSKANMNVDTNLGLLPLNTGLGVNGTTDNNLPNTIILNNGLNMDLNANNNLNGNLNILQSPNINLNNNLPSTSLNNPEIKIDNNLPNLNLTSPNINMPNTNANIDLAPLNMDSNMNTNGVGINMNNNDNGFFEMSGIIKGTNEVNNNGNLTLASGGININQNMTGVNPNLPKSDSMGINLNANPNTALGGDINNPNIILPSNNLNINENINVPKINITDPKIGGNFNGDLKASLPQDLNNNNYGMNVNIETSNTGGYGINIGQK